MWAYTSAPLRFVTWGAISSARPLPLQGAWGLIVSSDRGNTLSLGDVEYSGGRCVNEQGSNGCIRRTESYTDSPGSASGSQSSVQTSSPPIWLDELTCSGDEQDLGECQRAAWGVTDCGHKEDVGCICAPRPTVSPLRGHSRFFHRQLN